MSAVAVELPTILATGAEAVNSVQSDTQATRPETPSTSHPTSERDESTNPTTPSSQQHSSLPVPGEATPVPPKPSQRSTLPAVPVIPAIPKSIPKDASKLVSEKTQDDLKIQGAIQDDQVSDKNATLDEPEQEEPKVAQPPPNAWTTPKLWTGLFNSAAAATLAPKNGSRTAASTNFGKTNAETLAEALRSFSAISDDLKVAFLEPRGLVNTGNMCYMNSVCLSPLTYLMIYANRSVGTSSSCILFPLLLFLGPGWEKCSAQFQK